MKIQFNTHNPNLNNASPNLDNTSPTSISDNPDFIIGDNPIVPTKKGNTSYGV